MPKRTAPDDRLDRTIPEANRSGHEPAVVPDKPLVPAAAYAVDPYPAAPELDEGRSVRHPFAFDPIMAVPAAAVGVLGRTSYVEVDDRHLHVRFGPWSLDTPLENLAAAEVTGPYAYWKVIGPPHLGFGDRGITFATNRKAGLCIRFREPVPAIAPFGWLPHPAATVTVADPFALRRDLDRVRPALGGSRPVTTR